MGLGLIHYVPLIAYLGFCIMPFVSLTGRPRLAFYYMIPFLPYRTMRDHFLEYPLGGNALTILLLSIIIGALIQGKRLPKSKLYRTWGVIGVYLYFSLWLGVVVSHAPAPLWITDLNFVTWKDYMVIPLVFVAASLVIEDRKAVKTVVILSAITLLVIDRSCLLDSMSRSWGSFDENKRDGGPLSYGSNQTAAFLAEYGIFFWGFGQFLKKIKYKLICYALVALTIYATMYTFSRGAYLALVISAFVLGLLKDRKLLVILGLFLVTWQTVVPTAVRERVNMTENSNGKLEQSAQERVNLWQNAETQILNSPILGNGYATFQLGEHVDNLKDTHNWYVKILEENGLVGFIIYCFLFQQLLAMSYRLFKRTTDLLYRGLGLGLFVATSSTLVSNCFGDRWTYLEITSLLWVLAAAAVRATEFSESALEAASTEVASEAPMNPYLAYR